MSAPGTEALPPRARLDLHMHSLRSDGRWPAEEVLRRAAVGGLNVIALTDHDLPPALPVGPQSVAGRWVHVVHGVELSTMHEGEELHLLVWFPGEMPLVFKELCVRLCQARADRYDEAIARMGLPGLAPADEDARAGRRALTRLHLAKALVGAGHVPNLSTAFAQWCANRLPYVPPVALDFREAIGLARDAGGFTAWAHPPVEQAERWAGLFARAGLHALEAHRPNVGRGGRDTMIRLAFRNRMEVTGGSDWHGWAPGELGAFSFPLRQAGAFVRAIGLEA